MESGRRLLVNWHTTTQTSKGLFSKEKIAVEKWSRLEKERRLISFRLVFLFNIFSAIEPALFLVCALRITHFLTNGGRAHYIIESRVQWKPFWLATQQYPQNDWPGGKFPFTMMYTHCHHLQKTSDGSDLKKVDKTSN